MRNKSQRRLFIALTCPAPYYSIYNAISHSKTLSLTGSRCDVNVSLTSQNIDNRDLFWQDGQVLMKVN
jgi:hypothetical protein